MLNKQVTIWVLKPGNPPALEVEWTSFLGDKRTKVFKEFSLEWMRAYWERKGRTVRVINEPNRENAGQARRPRGVQSVHSLVRCEGKTRRQVSVRKNHKTKKDQKC